MSVVLLEILEGDSPNGSPVGTIDDAEAASIAIRIALNELGSGEVSIPRSHAKAALLVPGRYVKVTVPSVSEDPIFGFWLEDGGEDVLTSDDPEMLVIGGPGPLWVLRRGRLLEQIYAPGQTARGGAWYDNAWWWKQQPRGAILVRGIEEGKYQPGEPLDHVTLDFTREEDSDSTPWPEINGEWQTGIGTDILALAQALKEDGAFIVQGRPNLLVQAHQSYGRDLTGASFGAGVVRITEANLATEMARSMHARRGWTHILVKGKDSVYVTVEKPGWSGAASWGYYVYEETDDVDLLEQVGAEQLRLGDIRRDALQLQITPGFDEAAGRYMPGPDGTNGHVWVGDTTSIDVGDEDRESVVVAIRMETDSATDDTDDDTSARSLQIVLEYDAEADDDGAATPGRLTGTGSSGGSHNHPPVPQLCRPRVPPGDPTPDATVHSWTFTSDNKCDCHGTVGWYKAAGASAWSGSDGGIAATGGAGDGGVLAADIFAVSPGSEILIEFDQRNRWGLNLVDGVVLRCDFVNSGGTILATHYSSPAAVAENVWVNPTLQATAPSGTHHVKLGVVRGPSGSSGALAHDIDNMHITLVGSGSPGTDAIPGDGHEDLIGTSARVKRCDDTEHYHAAADPTVDDDASAGMRNNTWWFNETTGVSWFLLDNAVGAADWVMVSANSAAGLPYDNSTSGLTATDVQAAIDEIGASVAAIAILLDGGGDEIPLGVAGDVVVPFACTIEQVTLLGNQTGSIQVDIWKDAYANFPPTDADSITASAVPTISTAVKSQDSTLTGWNKTVAAGDVLRFNVDSVTDFTRVTLALRVRRA